MTSAGTDEHAVIGIDRYAAVEFDGASRRVRRVASMFPTAKAAELFAIEQGWPDYAVGPASIVVCLQD